jgi:Mrp family chromosome partitioning ATPase
VAAPAPLPVLLAVTGEPYEDVVVAALGGARGRLAVVRRCVDLADLLAAAQAGTARAALVAAGLRRLDADALARLATAGVAVVGLAAADDEIGERRLRQLGISTVVTPDGDPQAWAAAVTDVLDQGPRGAGNGFGDPGAALAAPAGGAPVDDAGDDEPRRPGRLVAVWGPTGAPGRSTLAVNLAAELADQGRRTLLADADTYGGSVAQLLGLLDEAPGLAAAARTANAGGLDVAALARYARTVRPRLLVLTGLTRPDRWPELRPAALAAVWARARQLADLVVVDCGFGLEQDEELAYDTAAPRRNGATLATLETADVLVAVGAADPVGVQRLLRALPEARERAPRAELTVVLNKVRKGPVGPDPGGQLTAGCSATAASGTSSSCPTTGTRSTPRWRPAGCSPRRPLGQRPGLPSSGWPVTSPAGRSSGGGPDAGAVPAATRPDSSCGRCPAPLSRGSSRVAIRPSSTKAAPVQATSRAARTNASDAAPTTTAPSGRAASAGSTSDGRSLTAVAIC